MTTIANTEILYQSAFCKLPISQKVTFCIRSASAKTLINKLIQAPQIAFNAIPESSMVVVLVLPNNADIKTINSVTKIAPKNAKKPTLSNPNILVNPNTMDITAPRPAPEDIPNRYGSAKEFCITACITAPVIANPAPINKANKNLGKRK